MHKQVSTKVNQIILIIIKMRRNYILCFSQDEERRETEGQSPDGKLYLNGRKPFQKSKVQDNDVKENESYSPICMFS